MFHKTLSKKYMKTLELSILNSCENIKIDK